jgi:hypothetical protein
MGWSAGGSLNTAREQLAGCGLQDAALSIGGYDSSYTDSNVVEKYNGTAWSIGAAYPAATRQLGACGIQTAALAFGGLAPSQVAATKEFDGVAWSAGGNLAAAVNSHAGAGTQDAGLSFGGKNGGTDSAATEEYNGTAWAAGGNLNTAKDMLAGCGTQEDALSIGGYPGTSYSRATEEYNGTAWSAGGDLNTPRRNLGACGSSRAAALAFGGEQSFFSFLSSTEAYDGSAWSSDSPMSAGRAMHGGAGTASAALAFGGEDDVSYEPVAATEEYSGAEVITGNLDAILPSLQIETEKESYLSVTLPILTLQGTLAVRSGELREYLPALLCLAAGQTGSVGILRQTLPAQHLGAYGAGGGKADLPLFNLSATGITGTAGSLRKSLPLFQLSSTGIIGGTGSLNRRFPLLILEAAGINVIRGRLGVSLPRLVISAAGLSGGIGRVDAFLPLLTPVSSAFGEGKASANIVLPTFYISAHGDFIPAREAFKVLAMNLRNFSVSEYENFLFNSFAFFNGIYLGAKNDGIYPLVGEKDQDTPIDAELRTGQIPMERVAGRDVWIGGRSGGDLKVILTGDEGTDEEVSLEYLLSTLGQDRAKVPRGLKPVYLKIGVKNIDGSDFHLDALQVFGTPTRRKKR